MVLLDRLRNNDKNYTEAVFYEKDFVKSDNFLDMVTAILTNTNIQTIRFHACTFSRWSAKQVTLLFSAIARLPKLTVLSIAQTTIPMKALAVGVEKSLQLRELDVLESALLGSNEELDQLAQSLKLSPLSAVYFKQLSFEDAIASLDPLLEACQESLDLLVLESLECKEGAISDDVFRSLKNSKLDQLEIRDLELQDSHMTSIAEALKESSLKGLSIHQIDISDRAVQEIAESLCSNSHLQRLCLQRCRITDKGAMHLATMLHFNKNLHSLDLSENQVSDKGAIELSNALLSPSASLKSLEIDGNVGIRQKGIQAIVQLAEQSYTLESLKLFAARKTNNKDQLELQRKITAYVNLNAVTNNPLRPTKRCKVWYE